MPGKPVKWKGKPSKIKGKSLRSEEDCCCGDCCPWPECALGSMGEDFTLQAIVTSDCEDLDGITFSLELMGGPIPYERCWFGTTGGGCIIDPTLTICCNLEATTSGCHKYLLGPTLFGGTDCYVTCNSMYPTYCTCDPFLLVYECYWYFDPEYLCGCDCENNVPVIITVNCEGLT